MSIRNIPSPPPAVKKNLQKIEEDASEEGQFEEMDQDMSSTGSTQPANSTAFPRTFNPPDISVTDERGNIKSHSHFSSCIDFDNRLHVASEEQFHSVFKNQRSRTFTTLNDAYEQSTHLPGSHELDNLNNGLPPNGFLTNMAMLRKSYEDIVVRSAGSSNADDILTRLKQVLDSQSIDYYELPSARSVQLTHSNVQLKMEVVQTGADLNSLRFRHVSGDSSLSRQLCNELLQHMSL